MTIYWLLVQCGKCRFCMGHSRTATDILSAEPSLTLAYDISHASEVLVILSSSKGGNRVGDNTQMRRQNTNRVCILEL